jgi:DNA-binding NtrC family response regulator
VPPILVIDDDGPTRAARSALLQQDGADLRIAPRPRAGANAPGARCEAMIADAWLLDTPSTAQIHELMQDLPAARLVARSQGGVMAAIHDTPDFQAMADRLAAK